MPKGTDPANSIAEIRREQSRSKRIVAYKAALVELLRTQGPRQAIELARRIPDAGDQLLVCDLLLTLFLDARDFASAGEVVRLLKNKSRRLRGWIRIARASGSSWEQRDLAREAGQLDTTDHELLLAVYRAIPTGELLHLIRVIAECELVDGEAGLGTHIFLELASITHDAKDFVWAWKASGRVKGWLQKELRRRVIDGMVRSIDTETARGIIAAGTIKDRRWWETEFLLTAERAASGR